MNFNIFWIISFLISVAVIPFFISFSRKKDLFDFSEGDILKIHKHPVSFLGGAAMLVAVIIPFLFLSFSNSRFVFIILGCAAIFLLGLWDDLKWKHITARRPYLKFFLLVAVSLISAVFLFFAGVEFYFFPVISFFYIFVLINAVNYQDGMDGQAGILVLISLIGFYFLSVISYNNFSAMISLVFTGAVLGFLIYNFPPAKIFMGDSGAYLLGFALVMLAIIFSENILSALFIVGVPLFDGVYSNLRRLLAGKSIFLGDRDHFYDRMLKGGFSAKKTLFISGVLQVIFVIIGISIYIYV